MSNKELLPAPRPNQGLNKLTEFPKEPPIPVPSDGSDEATFGWCESLRTHYEERGFSVSPKGLLKFVDLAGLEDDDAKECKAQVRKLYAREFALKEAAGKSPKTDKPQKKEKSVAATAEKKKAKHAAVPSKNGKQAAPSKNGKHTPKAAPDESETVYQTTIKGVEVLVNQTPAGRFNVTVGGVSLRKLAAWLGHKGWVGVEVRAAFTRLLKKWKGGEEYVKNVLEEGHVGSGAKANKAGKYCFGTLPEVDKATAAAVKSLKPSA